MKISRKKWNGILYEGGFDNFSVNGYFHMEREVLYKNNPTIEAKNRLNMAYLLLTNSQMVEVMKERNAHFLHGTNANALPSILKYGINSVDTSTKNDITVNTGEEWSRINGKRNFVSLTDCLHEALSYARMNQKDNNTTNELLNFGVVIGASFEDMEGIRISRVISDIPEIGVVGNLPVDHIKFLAVPDDKTEFVRKMLGNRDIEVVSMDMRDEFFFENFRQKLDILEQGKDNTEQSEQANTTYSKDDVKKIVNTRKISQIKNIFKKLKTKMHMQNNKTEEKHR